MNKRGIRLGQKGALVQCWLVLAIACLPIALPIGPASAQTSRAEQAAIRSVTRQVRPLPKVISETRKLNPYNEMDYLGGPEFDPVRFVYRLKFMDGNKVVFVYVDAISGRIIGRSR